MASIFHKEHEQHRLARMSHCHVSGIATTRLGPCGPRCAGPASLSITKSVYGVRSKAFAKAALSDGCRALGIAPVRAVDAKLPTATKGDGQFMTAPDDSAHAPAANGASKKPVE